MIFFSVCMSVLTSVTSGNTDRCEVSSRADTLRGSGRSHKLLRFRLREAILLIQQSRQSDPCKEPSAWF
jgi:hypothetical protein